MNFKETVKILAILNAFYGQGKANPETMANAWHVILKPFDYAISEQAVFNFAKTDTREYSTFPGVGQIVKAIRHEEKLPNLIYNFARGRELYKNLPERAKEMITEDEYIKLMNEPTLFYDEEGYLEFVKHLRLPNKQTLLMERRKDDD